jgi:hypothetical protein
MARRSHHHVYVIDLSKDVLFDAKFMRANPDCQRRLNIEPPCRSNNEPGRVANS